MTLSIDIRTPKGIEGCITLPNILFSVEPNIPLMHQVVNAKLAAKRQGTHSTKTRGEVSGGGKKPYRQKGTGRARQGSNRAPQFSGGGIVHGPKPRDYSQRTPKKMVIASLRGALSNRAHNGRIHVFTKLVDSQKPSTKFAKSFLETIVCIKKVLVVLCTTDIINRRSIQNLTDVSTTSPNQLNTYDVLDSENVLFSVESLKSYIAVNSKKEILI